MSKQYRSRWLYADREMMERITGVSPDSPAVGKRKKKFEPIDLMTLMIGVHLTKIGYHERQVVETAKALAPHAIWYAVMKGYGSLLISGTHDSLTPLARFIKAQPGIIEDDIGGKPQHHPYAKPSIHRFAIRSDLENCPGFHYRLVDDVSKELGKLKPFSPSTHVMDLWHFGQRLIDQCGPLFEIAGRCPDDQRVFAITDPKKPPRDAPDAIYSTPFVFGCALISPSLGGPWDDESL